MTNNATKTYLVSVIERAIAHYKVEAGDARTAAENWQEGEFHDRDDEALDTEGPCNVRERQHDGAWRKLPKSEWEAEPAAGTVTSAEGKTMPGSGHASEPWTESGMAIVQDAYGNIVADCDSPDLPSGWHRPNARRIVAAVNACKGIGTEALESGVIVAMREAMESLEEWADRYGLKAMDPRDQAAVDDLLDRASVVLESATPSAGAPRLPRRKPPGPPVRRRSWSKSKADSPRSPRRHGAWPPSLSIGT